MFQFLLDSSFAPFTLALGLLFGLLAIELVFSLVGASLLGDSDIAAPDAPDVADLDIDFDGLDVDAADFELAEFDDVVAADAPSGLMHWLGLGKVPVLIWLAAVLLAFGLSGMALQLALEQITGFTLSPLLAILPAGYCGLWFARKFGAVFARLLPKTETQALSERSLGRRMGIITQGTAARGRPAEVRVTDRFGNTHHLRAEPLRDDVEIPQGTEVLVLRQRREGGYLLVGL
jgi:hypothetical protein